ncbi:hypothetical protein GCM10010302_18630 [Streptomyces polychromogenes]|uniref:DUF2335 domain-containing protein n=1 Tax=Streptomyces polychromogenes TaxID=67342 RepID=A0ABN0V990_9ACTN
MSIENNSVAPVPRGDDPLLSAGLEIAMKWGQALGGPEQLQVALAALEPQLKREHQVRLKHLDMQEKRAERQTREAREIRNHRFRITSLVVGAVLSVAMLAGGVYVAKDAWWLASLLCGPSLISMAVISILRRHDNEAMKMVADTARRATNAASQAQVP